MNAPKGTSVLVADTPAVRAQLEQRGWLPPEKAKKLQADLDAAKQLAISYANEARQLRKSVVDAMVERR